MPISVVGSNPDRTIFGGGSSQSITITNTVASGDELWLLASANSSRTLTNVTQSGFSGTLAYTDVAPAYTNAPAVHVIRVTGLTGTGTVTMQFNASRGAICLAYVLRGVPSSPVVTKSAQRSSGSTSSLTGDSVTVTAADILFNLQFVNIAPANVTPTATGFSQYSNEASQAGDGSWASGYHVLGSAGTFGSSVVVSSPAVGTSASILSLKIEGPAASGATGNIAGTFSALTGSLTGNHTTLATVGGTFPAVTGSLAGVVTTTGALAGTFPALTGALGGSSGTTLAYLAGTFGTLTGDLSGIVTVTGVVGGDLPAFTGSLEGFVGSSSGATGLLDGTLPALTGDVVGISSTEDALIQGGVATYTGGAVIGLAPATDLAETVPVQRQSYLMPALDAAHPVYQPLRDYDVTVGLVGTVHLWIDHQDVTYLRGKPSRILRWDSEAPWGDKAAMFEFPQLDPWDVPGSGDLAFLRPDAPVTIGMVDSLGAVRVLWSGFLDSRGNGLGEGESYTWEAKGTLWAAAQVIHEPVPYLPPTDIGILVARTLNAVPSRRFHVRERRTGILTRTRGARDQWSWQYVQDLLSEAWTEDGRQWTLVEVAPGEFDIVLKKAMTTVDATVAYGTPLVDIDLRIDESTRVDEVFARGYSPAGGTWANVFYPGLELARPPAYPYSNPATTITLGTTDADTDSGSGVSDWQERARKLGYTTLTVTGVMSSAWVTVVRRVQGALGILVDGVIGPQTWNATFDSADLDIDLTPLRLPLAMKPWTRPVLYGAAGVVTGPNPNYDPTKVVRQVALSLGQITKADARPLMRTYLAVHGEAVATGTVTFVGCPNEVDRTRLTHGDNVKVLGFEGRDVVVQLASKSVALDDERSQYVVSFTVDESARDALTVEQLLERNRAALADPSRRPGNPNRDTRSVKDQGFSWDAESPCGVLPKTAVNGAVGLWSCITIPFAEVGQLAGLRLHGTHPFFVGIFASLRITENKLASIVGNPSASSDPWRPVADSLDEYGWIAGWGEQGNACGYSPGTETDGYTFTGDLIEASTLEYVTETPPYVTIALYMRGSSGYVWGEFEPAEQT